MAISFVITPSPSLCLGLKLFFSLGHHSDGTFLYLNHFFKGLSRSVSPTEVLGSGLQPQVCGGLNSTPDGNWGHRHHGAAHGLGCRQAPGESGRQAGSGAEGWASIMKGWLLGWKESLFSCGSTSCSEQTRTPCLPRRELRPSVCLLMALGFRGPRWCNIAHEPAS